ncbi:peptidylprolyl isomerase, partial [Enterobacter roggenkampii]
TFNPRVITVLLTLGAVYYPASTHKPKKPPTTNHPNKGLKNTRGTMAMASTQEPHSATAQFFINVADND